MAEHFIVQRFNAPSLEFDGELLADVSSLDPEVPTDERGRVAFGNRWTEIRIYLTESGRFVTEIVGMSTHSGETPIRQVKTYDMAHNVAKGLYRRDDEKKFLTDLAIEALEDAQKVVPEITIPAEDVIYLTTQQI